MDSPNDPLLMRAIDGDQNALAELLARDGLAIHAHIESRISAVHRSLFDADDVMQVTCMEAFLHIRDFVPSGPGSFAAWLRRLADNNLRDAVRELERDKRPSPGKRIAATAGRDSYSTLLERISATTTTASRLVGRDETRQAVQAALNQLPHDYAEAIRLYELDDLSGSEVAQRMGKSHGAVRMLLARAHERLAKLFEADQSLFRPV